MHKELGSRKKYLDKRLSSVSKIIFYYMKSLCADPSLSSFFHGALDILIRQDNIEAVANV